MLKKGRLHHEKTVKNGSYGNPLNWAFDLWSTLFKTYSEFAGELQVPYEDFFFFQKSHASSLETQIVPLQDHFSADVFDLDSNILQLQVLIQTFHERVCFW